MKRGIEEIYKSLLANSNIEPPEHLWDSISQNLDIDDVWTNISNDLALQPFKRIENLSLLMSAGLFVLAAILYSGPETGSILQPEDQLQNTARNELGITQENVDSTEMGSMTLVDPLGLESNNIEILQKDPNSNLFTNNSIEETYDLNRSSNNFYPEDAPEFQNIGNYDRQRPGLVIPESPTSFSNDLQWNTKTLPGYQQGKDENNDMLKLDNIGITGSLKNTWIINYKTISGFSSEELHSTKPIFGREFGIFFGSRINQRTILTLEYYFSSNYAQAYNEYIGGHYVSTSFNVDYHKINFIASYRVRPPVNTNRSFNLLFGPSIGMLNKAVETIDNDDLYVTDNYKRYVFGLTGGIQYDYELNRNLELLTGMRLVYGLTNIYKGTPVIPASFRITHPAAINLTLGLRYKFE